METAAKTSRKTRWALDPAHSEIAFKVRHMMIANVKGEFRKFAASLVTDGQDFTKSRIDVTIDAKSILTHDVQRDDHLRSREFFDVEKYPTLTFNGTSITKVDDDEYKVRGILSIKNVSREVELDVEFGGLSKDPWGKERAGFSLEGMINRKDYGLTWNEALETGGVLVGEEVKIRVEVEFVKQA